MPTFLDVGCGVGLSQLGCHQGGHQGGPQLGETESLLRTLGRLLALGKTRMKLSLYLIPPVRFQLLRVASDAVLLHMPNAVPEEKKHGKRKTLLDTRNEFCFNLFSLFPLFLLPPLQDHI